jgi:glycosyltransferase involved in cell wall biosynthesis
MKVLVLAPPLGATGGVQIYTKTLVRALEQILGKANVHLLAVPVEPRLSPNGDLSLSPGVKIKFLAASLSKAISWRPQLVICAHVGVSPVARIIQRVTGIRYWVVMHGIEVWGDIGRAKFLALRGASRLISVSGFTFGVASSRHGLSKISHSILPPSVQVDSEQNSRVSNPSKPEPSAPIVLTVGRLAASEKYKGHDVMLDAWPTVLKRVPGAIYCIVGDGDDRQRLEDRAKEFKVTDSIRFAGAAFSGDLRDWYHRCRVFAMPARTDLNPHAPRGEGFGIVFLEAMAHGKPVVGPREGAPSEFIRSGEHGLLVNPTDSAEVANALVELLQNKERADAMGRAARAWVIQEYSEDRFRQRLSDILGNDADTKAS